MDLKYVCEQYFTCMCFLGFIRYNKTFIACRFGKYENLFLHQYIFIFPSLACNECIILHHKDLPKVWFYLHLLLKVNPPGRVVLSCYGGIMNYSFQLKIEKKFEGKLLFLFTIQHFLMTYLHLSFKTNVYYITYASHWLIKVHMS